MPEAQGNGARLLEALELWPSPRACTVLLACGSHPDQTGWDGLLQGRGWQAERLSGAGEAAGATAAWRRGEISLLLGRGRFEAWAGWAEVGLATAGTATEQLVGLGIPVLSAPGPGPQFKAGFARRQSRLLGGAVRPCRSPDELSAGLELLLADGDWRRQLGQIGRRRMGPAGGSKQLALLLQRHLLG
jgi:uncharacterized protein (TIGR03492 family)